MNSHTFPCDHMIFVAKSSPKRTWVPRRVTDRLTVRRLVNINPAGQELHQPRHQENPSTTVFGHQEMNPRASPSSSKRMASSEPSRKRGREEVPPPPPVEPKKGCRPCSLILRRCHRHRPPSPRRCRRPRPRR
jgi:hypothetical protein